MAIVFEIDAVAAANFFQWGDFIDENQDIFDVVLFAMILKMVSVSGLVLVVYSFIWAFELNSGSTAAYSQ